MQMYDKKQMLENIEKVLENKRKTAMAYKEFFAGSDIKFFDEPKDCKSNFWLNAVLLPNKEAQIKFLEETNDNHVQVIQYQKHTLRSK